MKRVLSQHTATVPSSILPWLPVAFLALSWLPLGAQSVANPGFDENTFTVFPGYASGNGGTINGWTLSPPERAGLNPAGSSPFANNGAIPSAPNAAFLQAGTAGSTSMKTTVTGLTPGTKYNVSFRINARSDNAPWLRFSTDGDGPAVNCEVRRVATAVDATPYKYAAFEFTATAESQELTIANTRTDGDHTLLIDDVTVVPSSGGWSFAPWTGDDDSGIDPQYVYTHAVSLGSNAPVTINGVNFVGRETVSPGRFALTDLTSTFGNRTPNNVTGASANLAKDFRYNGPNTAITLENLKPNTQYVFTHYGLGFDAATSATPHRSATFASSLGGERFTANLNHYGQGAGIRVNYAYTTDALGSPVTISFPTHGSGTYHTSGFSNREAVPSTPPVKWTITEWFDDESSGVSPNHRYTHALSFGSAAGLNLNGVAFAGIAGANPAGANLTTAGLTAIYNNDANYVTGYGGLMARDFVHSGFPAVYHISGLTPGKDYVFTLYSVGWETGNRPGGFIGGIGEGMTVLDQDQFGDNQGVRFEYRYTAGASGTARITVSGFDGARSIHAYGLSNREADPMVGVKPEITLQPVGAVIGVGTDFILRVGAIGSATLRYEWKRGTETILGTTGPVLFLDDVTTGDNGDYTVTVINDDGSAISEVASLVVLDNVPGVFGTGMGFDGLPLAGGAVDPHFSLLVNPDDTASTTAFVQTGLPATWLPNSPTSQWIGPRVNTVAAAAQTSDAGEGPGTYVYRTLIDLTGFDLSTVKISGSWASDNASTAIRVNGVATGIVNNVGTTFGSLVPFIIDITNAPGLVAGVNQIDFVVRNEDVTVGYTGLRIDGLAAVAYLPPNTPPHIITQPVGGPAKHNSIVPLAVVASGSDPLTYKWFKGTEEIAGEVGPVLYLDILDPSAAGDYKVRVTNGAGTEESTVATVTIPNAVPVVVDDNLTTDQGVPLLIDPLFDMLANDTDADNDLLTLDSFAATSFNGGTVSESGGLLTYTPAPGFLGLDGFTYKVKDGWGGISAAGTVLITVNKTVNPQPHGLRLAIDLAGGTVSGTFTGAPGASYTMQRSLTLLPDSWTDIGTVVAPLDGSVEIVDTDPPPGNAFYRISYAP